MADVTGLPGAVNPPTSWVIGGISSPTLTWGAVRNGRPHQCKTCGIALLTGEEASFCCGVNGSQFGDVPPLPPLPPQLEALTTHPQISSLSRILNLIFSFASLGTTHPFPNDFGLPAFVAIQGRVYHHAHPSDENSVVWWLLFDGFMHDVPHAEWANKLPSGWIDAVKAALLEVNPFVKAVRSLSFMSASHPQASLILHDDGAAEIAAVMSYENTTTSQTKSRRLTICLNDHSCQSISTLSRLWEPLSYPLLFPHGSLGWGVEGPSSVPCVDIASDNTADQPTTQLWHYRARILCKDRFRIFGRLTNEYVVDMFSRNLETRLNFIRTNQKCLRREDAELMGVDDVAPAKNIYLPSSFLGSRRWASDQISDSLAIAAAYGNPRFFVTMTCNTAWPEIVSQLLPGQTFCDIPVVVVWVFRCKLSLLLKTLKTMFVHAGRVLYCIHSVEFQKRGLPHAHILLKYTKQCDTPDDIDAVVSAEVPDDPSDALLVHTFMFHHHPSADRPPSKYCQKSLPDGRRSCRFHYPHPLQPTTTIDPDGHVHYRRRRAGDEMVVPHCLPLLRKFRCHLNFEVSSTSHIFQYLFKYIHKGPDHTHYNIRHESSADEDAIDEIEDYWNARYLSAGEAMWRILGFNVTGKEPAVTALPIHLPLSTSRHQYHGNNASGSTASLLNRYFNHPAGSFIDHNGVNRLFDELTYSEYFRLF